MPTEHRENDKIILEEIRSLQKDVATIDKNLAVNTQETTRLAQYQEKMNGRVAGHEARMQVVEGAQAITSTAVASMQKNSSDWLDWLKKGAVVIGLILFYYLLTHAGGFPDFLN